MREIPLRFGLVVLVAVLLSCFGPAMAVADDPMPGVPGPPAPSFGGMYTVPVTMQVAHVWSWRVSFTGGVPAYNEPVTTEIQYGPTTAYGLTSEPLQPAIGISAGLSPEISILKPGTTYHWRFAVLKASGNVYTPDATVTTLPPGPVAVRVGDRPLTIAGGRTQLRIGCQGDPDDTCQGRIRLVATQLLHRHHRLVYRRVLIADDAYSASVGHDQPYPYTQGRGTIPIQLNHAGRTLLARTGLVSARATLTVERGRTVTTQLFLRLKP